eukprot:TRINITY_DN51246_c0_g1_i1.p1 TRINITY_DN51246_c0_g1~~TRINITY_DN51246_c0_g1_i1.p1  ORF type:complete len:178 (+),score=31.74 TRINITY_DN51246_c0_g1_i1:63-596(+)
MSDFWLRKMRTYFQRIDFDKDGAITRRDFEGMAQRFKETGKLSAEHAGHLDTDLMNIWGIMHSASGSDAINQDQFIEIMKKQVHDEKLKPTLEAPLPNFFRAVDSNDDKLISEDEFANFFKILGLDETLAPASFKAIDDNHDGQISEEEFRHNGSEFFLEEKDESKPSKLFWGPLVD